MSAGLIGPGEGRKRYTARGSVMFFKALAEQDDGDLSLMERTLPPGGRRPPPHRHTNCSEAYFVLDGLVSVVVEGEETYRRPRRVRAGAPRDRPYLRQRRGRRGPASGDPRSRNGRVLRRPARAVEPSRAADPRRGAGADGPVRHGSGLGPGKSEADGGSGVLVVLVVQTRRAYVIAGTRRSALAIGARGLFPACPLARRRSADPGGRRRRGPCRRSRRRPAGCAWLPAARASCRCS